MQRAAELLELRKKVEGWPKERERCVRQEVRSACADAAEAMRRLEFMFERCSFETRMQFHNAHYARERAYRSKISALEAELAVLRPALERAEKKREGAEERASKTHGRYVAKAAATVEM